MTFPFLTIYTQFCTHQKTRKTNAVQTTLSISLSLKATTLLFYHQPKTSTKPTSKSGSDMEESVPISIWDSVVELTKVAQQKGSDPLLWVIQLSSNLKSRGVSMPSVELANVLVSYIFWDNNVPITWKFLEKALMLKIVPPMLVFALLSTRLFFCFLFWCLKILISGLFFWCFGYSQVLLIYFQLGSYKGSQFVQSFHLLFFLGLFRKGK